MCRRMGAAVQEAKTVTINNLYKTVSDIYSGIFLISVPTHIDGHKIQREKIKTRNWTKNNVKLHSSNLIEGMLSPIDRQTFIHLPRVALPFIASAAARNRLARRLRLGFKPRLHDNCDLHVLIRPHWGSKIWPDRKTSHFRGVLKIIAAELMSAESLGYVSFVCS